MKHLRNALSALLILILTLSLLTPALALEETPAGLPEEAPAALKVFTSEGTGGIAEAPAEARVTSLIGTSPVPTYTSGDVVVSLIEKYEGFVAYPMYEGGVAYIGFGSTYADAVAMFGAGCEPITREQAKALTLSELRSTETYINRFLVNNRISLNQTQFDVIMDFTYNVGIGWTTYKNSDGTWCKLKQVLLDGPSAWTETRITEAFGTWVKNGSGTVLPGLVKRRAEEARLFLDSMTESAPAPVFSDVISGSWYYNSVMTAYEQGFVHGMGDGIFQPEGPLTRGQAVTLLSNFAGADTSGYTAGTFADCPQGMWYTPHVLWAASHGFVFGYDATHFGPEDSITREQFCAVVARFLRAKGIAPGAKTASFTDADAISPYARDAVNYCISLGLIYGMDDGSFSPASVTTRAQAAAILVRLSGLF